jgi:tRNA threonylcarbamoyladenosine biosynthesis protein TsaB
MLLALDTSTRYASVALSHDGALLADLTWLVENRHSAELLLQIESILHGQRVTPRQLDAIAVALGPGSFNGVRAGVSTAKGLALALGIPLVGVSTLDLIAWGARLAPGEIWALLDAGRGEVYAAAYDPMDAEPRRWAPRAIDSEDGHGATAYPILTTASLTSLVSDGATLVGELRPATSAAVETALAGRARRVALDEPRRGTWLARLGEARLAAGMGVTPAALEPLYLRRPAITQSARPDIAALASGGQAPEGQKGERLAL